MAAGANGWLVQAGAVLGPTLAAAFAVRSEGGSLWASLRDEAAASPPPWQMLALVPVMLGLSIAASLLAGIGFDEIWATYSSPASYGLWLFNLLVVGLLEEIGWRFYLTRRLLARLSPLAVSLVVGSVWALWHGPKLFTLPMLAVGALALSVIMTLLIATKRGGLFGCIALHGSYNAAIMVFEPFVVPASALVVFNLMAGAMAVVAIAILVARRDWYLARPR
ncbi:CPBP family intramembrane metalloprotease [Qipengyuania sp. 1NDH17]|uniref:CPBP family intramembrane metalloprotease n=1 Tax=Qipengyuania polymorpha TaxID=2867234 RepID=A0ABS7IV49_9SPHN|nr:CPBP family intramembrane glutamic endopeptidase [Qipengyuania polymorpha]MBX7457078.1 CPBP family intramembrane metalloprotease [Qipengyuania polymorpha]